MALFTLASPVIWRVEFTEHQEKLVSGFTAKYNASRLVYYESTTDVESAITREKQIKGWARKKKVILIESINPYWDELAENLRIGSTSTVNEPVK